MKHHFAGVEAVGQDLRLAIRSLRKSPAFVIVALLSLTLGIGANTTIFSVLDALLYRPWLGACLAGLAFGFE